MWAFLWDQSLCPLNGGIDNKAVPKERGFQEISRPRLPSLSRFWAADFWYSWRGKMAAHIARKALYVYGAFGILLFAKASYDCDSKYLHFLRRVKRELYVILKMEFEKRVKTM